MHPRTPIALLAATASLAQANLIGSPAIDRTRVDGTLGISLIYRGTTQPLAGDGTTADTFTLYSKLTGANLWTTPFLLEVTAPDQYTVVAVGTSRDLTGMLGEQSFPFATIAGDATLEPGKSYTFGYYNGAVADDGMGGTAEVPNTTNIGTIPFTGYDDFSDPWSYAFAGAPTIGTTFGTGGVALDAQGFAGRIYSANLSFVPAPASAALLVLTGLAATRRRR